MDRANAITISGNITSDPELRFTQGGKAMVSFSVAHGRRWKTANSDQWEERTSFIKCVAWGDFAEHIAESIQKGLRVMVCGYLEQQTWETDQGEKRSSFQIQISDMGPSLLWATASVNRISKGGGGGKSAFPDPLAPPVVRDDFGPDEAPF